MEVEADLSVQDERQKRNAEVALQRRRNREPFERAARDAGIDELYDPLTGTRSSDPRLFELALDNLQAGRHDDDTREWIARIFETRAAAAYWPQLLILFRQSPCNSLERIGLAAALSTSARAAHVQDMMDIVRDERFGSSRVFFLRPINRLNRANGKEFVGQYVDDAQLGREATAILAGRSRSR